MIWTGDADSDGRRAVILVRNTCTHDARVRREAQTLRGMGFDTVIVGVVSTAERERQAVLDGTPLIRLDPQSPLGRLRRRLRSPAPGRVAAHVGPANPPGRGRRDGQARRAAVRLHRFLVTLDYYRAGIGAVRALRPALVHCNDYNTMWIGVAARLTTGCALVYDSHELWPDRNLRPEPRGWLMTCEALFVRAAHALVTTSPGYARVMAERYRTREPVVVRNVPSGDRSPTRGARGDGTRAVAVYAGALTLNRGLEQAIDAIAGLPGVTLRLIGPGAPAYVAELRRRAERAGVADRLEISAPVDPSALVETLQTADVGLALIQPSCLSYRLTLPNKLFEYVAAHLPILGSDLPVIASFIRAYGVGRVAAPDDIRDITQALRALLGPEENARVRRAVADAARELTWERERTRLVSVYGHALERAG